MPILNQSPTDDLNAGSAGNLFEQNRVTPTVGAGREVIGQHGQNAASPANTFEARCSQEAGTH
jgi:hypothetical protein